MNQPYFLRLFSRRVLRPSLICLIFLFIQLTVIHTAFSESEDKQKPEIYSLGEIVFQGKGGGVDAAETIRVITSEDISDSGARNLVEAIDLVPGVYVSTGGKGIPNVNLRGFRTRHVLLLLNGIPMNSAFDQQFDASIIPVENIDKIKLTVGPSSVLYGQGGAGGVINIITKKGIEGILGKIGAETGEGGTHLEKASLSGGGKKFDFFLSGSNYARDSYPLSKDFVPTSEEDGGDRNNSGKETRNFFSNIGYDVNDKLWLGLTFNYVSGSYGIPGSVINNFRNFFAPSPKYERCENFEGFSFQLAGDYRMLDMFNLRSWVFLNQMNDEQNRYDSPSYDRWITRYDKTATSNGITLQPILNLKEKGMLSLGFSFQNDNWDSDGEVLDHLTGWPPTWVIAYPKADRWLDIYSLTAEYEFKPVQDLELIMGYGYHNQNREEGEESDNSLLLAGYYDVMENLRLKIAFQRNIRFPSLRQLYDEDSGNILLRPELVTHYTAGAEMTLPLETSITLNGFISNAKNFIEKDKNNTYKFQNFEEYDFRGAELSIETHAIKRLMLRAGYSLLHTEDQSNSGRKELHYRPENKINFEAKYSFDFGLSAYVSVLHIGDQYYYTRTPPYRKAELDSFTLTNIKITQKLFNGKYQVYAGVNNLFDIDYSESYGLPQAGRYMFAGMEMRF